MTAIWEVIRLAGLPYSTLRFCKLGRSGGESPHQFSLQVQELR
jgi:hypothetical protein